MKVQNDKEMNKTIEDVAWNIWYKYRLNENDSGPMQDIFIKAFIVGDAYGHARAIDEASEGYREWDIKMFRELGIDMSFKYGLETWQASRLSAQKEIDHLKLISEDHSRAMESESDALKKIKELENELERMLMFLKTSAPCSDLDFPLASELYQNGHNK